MEAIQTANTATPEEVWAILKRVGERQEELAHQHKETEQLIKETAQQQKETDRLLKESKAETDRLLKESKAETDRQMKDFNKRFGEFTNRFGEVVEYMIAPNLCEKFREFDLFFLKSNSGTRVNDHENNIFFEVDVMLENSNKAMLVEVKTKLTTEHINDHIERIEKMRKYADLHGDRRAFLGAAAGVVMTPNVKKYALTQGLYVIEPSGETFNITPPENKPKEW